MLITIAANCVVLIITTPLPMQDNSSLNRKLVSLVVFVVNRNYKRKFYEVFAEVTLVESFLIEAAASRSDILFMSFC